MRITFIIFFSLLLQTVLASKKDSTVQYNIPDSIKAIGVLVEVQVNSIHKRKENAIGIQVDDMVLKMEADKKEWEVEFEFPETATIVAKGMDVEEDEGELSWSFKWNLNEPYQLMLTTATDSAANFILYSGYIYFPKQNKWKLIGTCKMEGKWGTIKNVATWNSKNKLFTTNINKLWLQRNNGTWKNLLVTTTALPTIGSMSNIDSAMQATKDDEFIQQFIAANKTTAVNKYENIYYHISTQGNGKKVQVTDTTSVYYKGYLLSNNAIFDQTKDKPVSFPLNRLIKGWQIGVPLLQVGGKITIVIPSGLAYGIRSRAAKIPPNSILVFDIEVVAAKP